MFILCLIGTLISRKCYARKARWYGGCKKFQLSSNSPLPPQNQVFTISETIKQLIQIVVETLVTEAAIPRRYKRKLVATGQNPTPTETAAGGTTISNMITVLSLRVTRIITIRGCGRVGEWAPPLTRLIITESPNFKCYRNNDKISGSEMVLSEMHKFLKLYFVIPMTSCTTERSVIFSFERN